MNKYAAEFYGTFLLLVSILGTFHLSSTVLGAPDHITVLLIALAVAAILFSNINIFIKVSGAHFNPAVSLMMFIKGNLNLNDCLLYIDANFWWRLRRYCLSYNVWSRHFISIWHR